VDDILGFMIMPAAGEKIFEINRVSEALRAILSIILDNILGFMIMPAAGQKILKITEFLRI